MPRIRKSLLQIIPAIYLLLTGCSAPLVLLPDDVGNDGLLVGQVSSITWPEISLSDPLISFDVGKLDAGDESVTKSGSPNVVKKKYIGGLRANTIVLPLAPGEYTLEGFQRLVGGESFSTPAGTYSRNSYITYPVKKKFTIHSGRATNLGMIVIDPFMQKSKKKLEPFFLDNTYELTTFLEDRHSKIFNSLESKDFINGYKVSLSAEKLNRLRRYVTEKTVSGKRWRYHHPNDVIVTGKNGTLARIVMGSEGSAQIKKLFDAYSVADYSNCGVSGSRAVCVVSPEIILLIDDDQIKWRTLPDAKPINTATAFGEKGILLIDDSRRLHISYDNGSTWTQYTGMQKKEPIERSKYEPIDVNSFGIYLGESGYYVFEKNSDGPIVYADYSGGKHHSMNLPDTVENIMQVEEKGDRLFIGPSKTDIFDDKLHYMSLSSQQWKVIEVPTNLCSKMVILDEEANHIELFCGERDVQVTRNQGATWSKKFVSASYFNGY
ncbi:MAG: hypothetical protein ABW092_03020 [Candidatus Thiodiazotropha sp.]